MPIDVNKESFNPKEIYHEQQLTGLKNWKAEGVGESNGKKYTIYRGKIHHNDAG